MLCYWTRWVIQARLKRRTLHVPNLMQMSENNRFFLMFSDYVLENNVIASYQVTSEVECGSKCLRDTRCLSFNYKITNSNMDECEINKANKSTCPGCYHAQKNSIYYDYEVSLCQELFWILIWKCSCRLRVRTLRTLIKQQTFSLRTATWRPIRNWG